MLSAQYPDNAILTNNAFLENTVLEKNKTSFQNYSVSMVLEMSFCFSSVVKIFKKSVFVFLVLLRFSKSQFLFF